MGANEDALSYFVRLERLARELRDGCNQTINDDMMTGIVVNGAREEFAGTIAALRAAGTMTMTKLQDQMIAEDNRIRDNAKKNQADLFAMKGQQVVAGQTGRKDTRECFHCGKLGHIAKYCRTRIREAAATKEDDAQKGVMMMIQAQCNVQQAVIKGAEDKLLFDTGATHHIVVHRQYFQSLRDADISTVKCGGGELHKVLGQGTVTVQGIKGTVHLTDVLYVPSLTTNVLSGITALHKGFTWSGKGHRTMIWKNKQLHLTARLNGSMMLIEGKLQTAVTTAQCYALTTAEKWHHRLGHAADNVLSRMTDAKGNKLIDNKHPPISRDCEDCLKAKQHRATFHPTNSRAQQVLDLVYADLMDFGENVPSYGGGRYVLVLIDDHSRYSTLTILRTKAAAAQQTVDILRQWQTQTGHKLKEIRTDEGTEFRGVLSAELKLWGARHQETTPYTPQQNGRVERVNRTLTEKMRALLFHAEVPDDFWAEALHAANTIRNSTYMDVIKGIPAEVFYNKTTTLDRFRVFGCLAYVHVHHKYRQGKLAARSQAGIFVGYEDNKRAWRVAVRSDNRWIIVSSCDVHFVEHRMGYAVLTGTREVRDAPPPLIPVGYNQQDPDYEPSMAQTQGETSETTEDADSSAAVLQPTGTGQAPDHADHQPHAAIGRQQNDRNEEQDESSAPEASELLTDSDHHQHSPSQTDPSASPAPTEETHTLPTSLQQDQDITGDMELSDAEEQPRSVAEAPLQPAVPPVQWHTNPAMELLTQECVRRSSRTTRKPVDDYVQRFMQPVGQPSRTMDNECG